MPAYSTVASSLALVASLLAQPAAAIWPKRGLAYNDGVPITEFGGSWGGHGSQVNWQWNWDSTTPYKQPWAEFVPMLWGTQSYHTDQWFSNADYWLSQGGSGHLMAFNEPDRPDQASMSVGQAVDAWRTYMEPFRSAASLGAPAVSNAGFQWIKDFLDQCTGCKIDFIPIHIYDSWNNAAYFRRYINDICSISGGRKVWITEFQASGTIDQQSDFLEEMMPWLDNNDCIFRYSYFGVNDVSKVLLQNGGPALSPLGIQYAYSPYGQGNL